MEEEGSPNDSEQASEGKAGHPFDVNHYATRKSAAQSMLDVALLMANSSQLKTLLHSGHRHRFFHFLLVLVSLSISLQVIVGILLIFIVKDDLNDAERRPRLSAMNDVATIFVFFTVVINVFITALGFEYEWMKMLPEPHQSSYLNHTNTN